MVGACGRQEIGEGKVFMIENREGLSPNRECVDVE
jgi:hypothetical protein